MDKPDPPERERPTHRILGVLAVLAVAGSLVALYSMAAPAKKDTAGVDLAAQDSGLALPALPALPALGAAQQAAQPAAPQQQQQAAQPAGHAAASPKAATKTVEMMGYKFSPATLTVAVGDTVTWTNHDQAPHNVVVTDGPEKFTSPLLQTGQSFTYTFAKAGTYSYYCSVHPDMTAKVTVTGGGGTTPPTTNPPTTDPTTPAPPTSCVPKAALQPLIDHIRSAHLQTSPVTQVTEILNTDQYVKTHTVLLDQMLLPVFNGSADQAVKDALAPLIAHIRAAHLETSLFTQLTELLNVDQYVKTHTVMLEQVLTPLLNQATC